MSERSKLIRLRNGPVRSDPNLYRTEPPDL